MNFGDLLSVGLDTLAGFDRDAALAACIAPSRVREWQAVHGVYFGPTKFTRRQAEAREAARGASLDKLALIERKLVRVADPAERWQLRGELLLFNGPYTALSRHADRLIEQPKPAPEKQARFTRSRGGMRTLTLTYAERDIADLEHALRQMIDPQRPAAAQMADALVCLLRGDAGDAGTAAGTDGAPEFTGVPHAVPRPMILIPLPDWTRIRHGSGAEVELLLTDGTSITGAEFLAKHFGAELEVAVFHPREGAVNLYRCLLYTSPSPRDRQKSRMPSSA